MKVQQVCQNRQEIHFIEIEKLIMAGTAGFSHLKIQKNSIFKKQSPYNI